LKWNFGKMKWQFQILSSVLFFACGNNHEKQILVVAKQQNQDSLMLVESAPSNPMPDYDTLAWQELSQIEPDIVLDLRYATDNNFVKKVLYDCPRCFLRPETAKALVSVHSDLSKMGLGLKVFDCYRPQSVQYQLWEIMPDHRYVAHPAKGSMHNRGIAVDLTIVDSLGNELDMGTSYDYFGKEAYHKFTDFPQNILDNRQLLMSTMEKHGFRSTATEWWHYSLTKGNFPLDDWVWNCR
jgi:zinc D-Ala-D-Ala dipeptidase